MRTHSETDIAMKNHPFLLVCIIKMVDFPSLKIVWYLSDWKLRSEFVREVAKTFQFVYRFLWFFLL